MTQVIEALKNNNIRFEETENMIGIYVKNVWHWFRSYDSFLVFNHSYSQNTGKTKKGLIHGLNVRKSISKKIGVVI